jgi:hypothetical protein
MPFVKGTPEERFRDRIIMKDDHWLFKGAHNGKGYVVFWAYGRIYAHRFSYLLFFGYVPDELDVLHTCDVRNCVNPSHLFLGTNEDNMQDASRKGRLVKSPELREKHRRSSPHGDDHWTRKVKACQS